MSLTILSPNGRFKAIVSEIRDGSRAVFLEDLRGWRKVAFRVYDLPLHAALDEAYREVCRL